MTYNKDNFWDAIQSKNFSLMENILKSEIDINIFANDKKGDMVAAETLIDFLNEYPENKSKLITLLGEIGVDKAKFRLIGLLEINYKIKKEERDAAAESLKNLLNADDFNNFIADLSDEDSEKRYNATRVLRVYPNYIVIEKLIYVLLNDNDEFVRERAAYSLGDISNENAIEPLITALKDKSDFVRGASAVALGYIEDENAIDQLILALSDDENPGVRLRAARSLGLIGSKKATKALINALQDSAPKGDFVGNTVNKEAAQALGKIGDKNAIVPLIEALESWSSDSRIPNSKMVAVTALENITQKDFGNDTTQWWKYYEEITI